MEVLDELNYQFLRHLKKDGFITPKELFIDGTKIEANANRYTFVWRESINYHLAGLLDTTDALYTRYNTLLHENGYGPKYDLGDARMFVIEGMEKVRRVIEENRKRKLTKHKKLSNNTVIEIDNCSPLEILKLQKNLLKIARGEGIGFVHSKGRHKTELQKLYEEPEECGKRLMGYKECFESMGKDRTDYNTLIPVIKKHQRAFGEVLEEVTADSGYCSEKNLLYLKEHQIASYIKLQEHERRKTRAYKEDIGKYYNMTYQIFEDEHYYICHDGRELRHIRTESKEQDGYVQTIEVYGCADCIDCEHKPKCLYKYNADRNKVMKINERWEELKEESNGNIQSERGILKRQIRSIQTEGHFGDIKENENFRRFLHHEIEKYEVKKGQETA